MKKDIDVIFYGIPGDTGKTSTAFLKRFDNKTYKNVSFVWRHTLPGIIKYIEKKFKSRSHIFIIPIYNEDSSVVERRRKKNNSKGKNTVMSFEFAETIENLCKKYQNCEILHKTEIGKILGNKLKTNEFYSKNNVRCPKVITEKSKKYKIFTNEIENSHTENSGILKTGKEIDPKMYNTEFIDTTFDYKNKFYYCCIRAMCIGDEISEIYLRFRNKKEKNAVVHNSDTPLNLDLNNLYYETRIMPNYLKLKSLCSDAGKLLGLGFYSHDILLCNKTNKFYIAETGFKFYDKTWKNHTKKVSVYFKNEKNEQDTLDNIFRTFSRKIIEAASPKK